MASPPITLMNFPNRVVGAMNQVTDDIAEAVEFVLRYDIESRNSLPREIMFLFFRRLNKMSPQRVTSHKIKFNLSLTSHINSG